MISLPTLRWVYHVLCGLEILCVHFKETLSTHHHSIYIPREKLPIQHLTWLQFWMQKCLYFLFFSKGIIQNIQWIVPIQNFPLYGILIWVLCMHLLKMKMLYLFHSLAFCTDVSLWFLCPSPLPCSHSETLRSVWRYAWLAVCNLNVYYNGTFMAFPLSSVVLLAIHCPCCYPTVGPCSHHLQLTDNWIAVSY